MRRRALKRDDRVDGVLKEFWAGVSAAMDMGDGMDAGTYLTLSLHIAIYLEGLTLTLTLTLPLTLTLTRRSSR